jgi:hypothetical protein
MYIIINVSLIDFKGHFAEELNNLLRIYSNLLTDLGLLRGFTELTYFKGCFVWGHN